MIGSVKEMLDGMVKESKQSEKIAEKLLKKDKFEIASELQKNSDNWRIHYSTLRNLFQKCEDKDIGIAILTAFEANPPRCSKALLSFMDAEREKMVERLNLQKLVR